ncbi:MAG: AraC family transcriptional regulator [Bacteroides sp.]|nr:AraC family transcriptional regulator [Bacteroides sp.]
MPMKEQMDYLDNDIMLSEKLVDFPHGNNRMAYRVNFFLMVACEEGEMQIHINGNPYLIRRNDILIILPTMLISETRRSTDNRVRLVGFSSKFLNRIVKKDRFSERMFFSLYQNPIRSTEGKEHSPMLHHYMALLMDKIEDTANFYRRDILQYLFSAIFCEMMNELRKHLGDVDEPKPDKSLRRAGYVFKQFLAELSKDGGIHRSVSYYADRLCYSPKYVSSIIKQVSGRTALDWINEYTVEQIKIQLKHTDKSVKEIADHFNFSNQSFFGKYVKAHLGMSPARYRLEGEG